MRTAKRAALGAGLWLCCALAQADDVRVDAETTVTAYDVQSPASDVVWARRRLIQTLALTYVKPLAEARRGRPPPNLQLYVRLRLDQDFGDTCLRERDPCFAIVNPERRGSYTPVADVGGIDLPAAYLEARGLAYGGQARVGRQLYVDEVGLLRLDGASGRIAPRPWLAFEVAVGALVRNTSVAAADAFGTGSVVHLSLDPRARARLPYRVEDATTWVASVGGEMGDERVVRARLRARALHERGGFVEQRLGASLVSQPSDALRLDGRAVFDAIDPGLIDAEVGLQLTAAELTGQLRLERHEPRFEPSTIWAYFDLAPIWLASVAGQWAITEALLGSLGTRGRRTEFPGEAEYDAGLDAALSWQTPRDELSIAGFGWTAELGPLWGMSLGGSRAITYTLRLEAEVSLFRVDDPLRAALRGFAVQELIGARLSVGDESELRVIATHSHAAAARHRLSLLFFLQLGAWR